MAAVPHANMPLATVQKATALGGTERPIDHLPVVPLDLLMAADDLVVVRNSPADVLTLAAVALLVVVALAALVIHELGATALAATMGPQRCRAGWVDPDTPIEFLTASANYHKDKREYDLVFSDEFEQDGRSFEDGSDPRWTAIDKNDCESV